MTDIEEFHDLVRQLPPHYRCYLKYKLAARIVRKNLFYLTVSHVITALVTLWVVAGPQTLQWHTIATITVLSTILLALTYGTISLFQR